MERCAGSAGAAFEATGAGAVGQEIPGAGCDHYYQRGNPEGERRERRTLFRLGGLRLRDGLRLGGDADLQRIDPYRLSDVLELGRAEVGHSEIEPPLDLPVGLLRETDRTRLADAL
jgi:hypothetical protein